MNPKRAFERREAALLHLSFLPTAALEALVLTEPEHTLLLLGVLSAWVATLGALTRLHDNSDFTRSHFGAARRELGRRLWVVAALAAPCGLLLRSVWPAGALLSVALAIGFYLRPTLAQAGRAWRGELPHGHDYALPGEPLEAG